MSFMVIVDMWIVSQIKFNKLIANIIYGEVQVCVQESAGDPVQRTNAILQGQVAHFLVVVGTEENVIRADAHVLLYVSNHVVHRDVTILNNHTCYIFIDIDRFIFGFHK